MQFRLRTLLIVLALGPMVLAGAWHGSPFAVALSACGIAVLVATALEFAGVLNKAD
jgi:hypothetical protein